MPRLSTHILQLLYLPHYSSSSDSPTKTLCYWDPKCHRMSFVAVWWLMETNRVSGF